MRRSQINSAIRQLEQLCERHGFKLPPFCCRSPDQWATIGHEADALRETKLGWDVTDFGRGEFERYGLTLITLRNGLPQDETSKPYAEKIMRVGDGQITPFHFHFKKTEDIINRGGGELVLEVRAVPHEQVHQQDHAFEVLRDGITLKVQSGDQLRLKPGESITLKPYVYHSFWAEGGEALVGEVSKVNDDDNDNRFLEAIDRFPAIEEDESPYRLLCNEYPDVPSLTAEAG